MADEPLILPSGYGMRKLTLAELRESDGPLLDTFCIWEPPRRRGQRRYVLGVDVADGLGLDRSVVEVVRMGTIEEPSEQVAEYVSDQISPMALAFIVHTIGQYYRDEDGLDAMAAIECNNHGLSTQDTLQLHLGYTHFYRWEYYEAADPSARFSNKIGWVTTPRTRPLLLDKLHHNLKMVDPVSGKPDLVTHSPILHAELKDFQTEGALWEAEAARGATDDCVLAIAIANYVAWKLQAGETEPLDERRRRRSQQQLAQMDAAIDASAGRPDWRNSPATAEEMDTLGKVISHEPEDAGVDELLYSNDYRARDW